MATLWADIAVPLLIAFGAGAVAVFWPWVRSAFRGRKFEGIFRRELEELGPHPRHPVGNRPWWEHVSKRFVHEEIFARAQISGNLTFLLSLDATVVYRVSQLWIAFGKRDGEQWIHLLRELSRDRRVGSHRLRRAVEQWEVIMAAQPLAWHTSTKVRGDGADATLVERNPAVFEKRLEAYGKLMTSMGSASRGKLDRDALTSSLIHWYCEDGAGLLLSGRALNQYLAARAAVEQRDASDNEIREALSALRTELKVDLGVRQPDERHVVLALPEAERRW